MSTPLVVVTGGSGFIASHIINQLLTQGYAVRTTLRSLTKVALVKAMLKTANCSDLSALTFVEADLTTDQHWDTVMQGAKFVIHPASPTPTLAFADEQEMIHPAVDGVLRVLRAASAAGVQRVVLTSAYGAIFAGHRDRRIPFTEEVWSDLSQPDIQPYQKSKTLAEKAAWDFIHDDPTGMTLATVNPVAVMGPVLAADFFHSNLQIQDMLNGKTAVVPQVDSGYVDVRDVASLHLLAMMTPAAANQRFLATTGETLSMLDVANILRAHFPAFATRLPQREIPTEELKLAAQSEPMLKIVASVAGTYAETSNAKAMTLLNWRPRSAETAIVATAQSMIALGIVKA